MNLPPCLHQGIATGVISDLGGSVAKYVAVSTLEAGFDVASMAESSTKVFILGINKFMKNGYKTVNRFFF